MSEEIKWPHVGLALIFALVFLGMCYLAWVAPIYALAESAKKTEIIIPELSGQQLNAWVVGDDDSGYSLQVYQRGDKPGWVEVPMDKKGSASAMVGAFKGRNVFVKVWCEPEAMP